MVFDFQNGGAGAPPDPVKALQILMGLPQRKTLLEQQRGAAPEGRVQKYQLRNINKNISHCFFIKAWKKQPTAEHTGKICTLLP